MTLSATDTGLAAPVPYEVQLIVFDLDGTLVHSGPDIALAVNLTLRELEIPPYPEAKIMSWLGNGVNRLIKRALTGTDTYEPEQSLFERAHGLFVRYYGAQLCVKSTPYPEVVAVLRNLKDAGFELACLTNKPEIFTLPLMSALDLDHYFRMVISGDSLPQKKPDPEPLFHICDQLQVAPNRCAMVGDSISDILAAQAAGMPVICVSFGYNQGIDLTKANPNAIIDSFAELPAYFKLI